MVFAPPARYLCGSSVETLPAGRSNIGVATFERLSTWPANACWQYAGNCPLAGHAAVLLTVSVESAIVLGVPGPGPPDPGPLDPGPADSEVLKLIPAEHPARLTIKRPANPSETCQRLCVIDSPGIVCDHALRPQRDVCESLFRPSCVFAAGNARAHAPCRLDRPQAKSSRQPSGAGVFRAQLDLVIYGAAEFKARLYISAN
ncbi:hypothetical protein SBA5_440034 [Candidatus Sulfotelmatomonas gaucii]|uniref:Uncharacterized protein n=1 Tax=Candidatus Sulfuritelmatomonas gaucii TaxID=2043161 RepID=A0A2N9LMC8_9BACT|nr:hypothetical protein SBA5_440034 [Candidatus Sulfotelmatomonas gaucii]